MILLQFIVTLTLIAGSLGHISRRYEIHQNKKQAYLGYKRINFFNFKIASAKLTPIIPPALLTLTTLYVWIYKDNSSLLLLWLTNIITTIATLYLIYEDNRDAFKKYYSIIKRVSLGSITLSIGLTNVDIQQYISATTMLPQGELPASETFLFSLQVIFWATLIFIAFSYITIFGYYFLTLIRPSDTPLRKTSIIFGLLHVIFWGLAALMKTAQHPGYTHIKKEAIVFASYSTESWKCEETKDKNVKIAFIRNSMVSIAEYEDKDNIIFRESFCTKVSKKPEEKLSNKIQKN